MTLEDLPLWVFRVAALLQDYEDIHEYKNECLQTALITIPREVHEMTRFLRKHNLLDITITAKDLNT